MERFGTSAEALAVKHRVRQHRIVIARQQHHRDFGGGDHRRRAVDQLVGQTMTVEGVAGEQHDVGADAARGVEHASEPRGPVAAMDFRGVDVVHMDVGRVYDDNLFARHHHFISFFVACSLSLRNLR